MSAIPNKDIREHAKDVVNTHLGRIIMLTLAAFGATFALLYGAIFYGAGDLMGINFNRMTDSVAGQVMSAVGTLLILLALVSAIASMLQIGYLRGLQLLASGVKVKGGVLISRSKHTLGCVGLFLWIGVKTMVWAIPGSLLQSLSTLLMATGGNLATIVSIIAAIVDLCLVIPASMRYALAPQVFAENPEIGVYDAVERSKTIMANRKWQLFCLTVPYVLLAILTVVGAGLIAYLFTSAELSSVFLFWLSSVVTIGAVLLLGYLMLLSNTAIACYYNAHKE